MLVYSSCRQIITLEASNPEIETHVYVLLLLRHVQISPIRKLSANLGISLEGNQASPNGILRILSIQLTQNTGTNVIDQAVDLESTFLDRVQNHALLGHHIQTLTHIQLHELQRSLLGRQRLQQSEVALAHLAQRQKPGVQNTQLLRAKSLPMAAATPPQEV